MRNHHTDTLAGGIGFIGLGIMGLPMARNLLRATPLRAWNRSAPAAEELRSRGALIATSAAEVVACSRIVFVMLSDEAAIDSTLPFDGDFTWSGRTLVLMSTVSPRYAEQLATRIARAGGRMVEAPVSGSREPAAEGTLVCMAAGDDDDLDAVEPFLRAMCGTVFRCGVIPRATNTKLAVNTFLVTMVTGLAECVHFAESNGVPRSLLRDILDAGPMASAVSRAKLAKLVDEDWSAHAAIVDVLKNARLIEEQARVAGSASPLIDWCVALYARAAELGRGDDDMAAVIAAFDALAHPVLAARR